MLCFPDTHRCGRIIAIMLGRLGLTIDEAIKAYKDIIAPKMFTPKYEPITDIKSRYRAIKEAQRHYFDANNLEEAVKQVLRSKRFPENEAFQTNVSRCHV
jgi:hypothetical protein